MKRVDGYKRLANQKRSMRDRFLAQGGTMGEFEKAWPELKAEMLKKRTLGRDPLEEMARNYARQF